MSPAHHKTPRSVVDSLRSRRFVVALPYAALFGLAFYLLFCNLDGRLLWGDEAETALLAKNVLRFGIPKTVDGVNHITELGNFRDENTGHIWTWTPWLQEYVTAASYLVLGETTWSSRAPFAAIAWLSIVLLALVVYQFIGTIASPSPALCFSSLAKCFCSMRANVVTTRSRCWRR